MYGLVSFVGNWHWYIDALCVASIAAFWFTGSRQHLAGWLGLFLLLVAAAYGLHFEHFLGMQGQAPHEVVVMRYDPGVFGAALVWAPLGAFLFCHWLTRPAGRT